MFLFSSKQAISLHLSQIQTLTDIKKGSLFVQEQLLRKTGGAVLCKRSLNNNSFFLSLFRLFCQRTNREQFFSSSLAYTHTKRIEQARERATRLFFTHFVIRYTRPNFAIVFVSSCCSCAIIILLYLFLLFASYLFFLPSTQT